MWPTVWTLRSESSPKSSSSASNLATWDKLFTTLSLGFSICEGRALS